MATLKDLLVSGPARVIGNITGKSFIKEGGTSSQFLKADGSVDSNAYSTTSHNHTTSIAASSGTNQLTLAFGTKYSITAGGTSYIFTMPGNPNTDTNTTYTIATGDEKGQIKVTPSSGSAYNVKVKGLGSAAYTESSAYAASGHTHDYLPLSGGEVTGKIIRRYSSTSNDATIHVLSKNTDNYIWKVDDNDTPGYGFGLKYIGSGTGNNNDLVLFADNQAQTQKEAFRVHQDGVVIFGTTPLVGSTAVSLSNHTHATTIAASSGTNQITLAFGTKYAITAGGTSYVFTMPSNPNTNTTYTFATGDANGQIKVTPSGGSAQNVSVKGLGSAAYTESSAYAASGHTHTTSIAASSAANQINLAFGTKYAITAGGTSYVFTMPSNPNSDTNVKQDISSTNNWRPILMGYKYGETAGFTPEEVADISYVSDTIQCSPGQGAIFAKSYMVSGGTSSQFLKADGSLDGNTYSLSNHSHSGYAASSHTHGNITSGGALQTTDITIANGDKLVVTDASDSNKVARTSIAFDGSTTTQVLSKKGTWVSLPSDTDSKVSQKLEESTSDVWRPILLGYDSKREFGNFNDSITNHSFIHNKIGFNIKSGYIRASGFVLDDSTGFLLANGGVDNSSYALSNHSHSGYAASSHAHGSITSAGAISSDTAIANGDHLVITDASDSNKIKRTSITFGTSTSTYLRNDGTWGTPSGGSGGGSTVSANNITLSTSAQTYITVDGSNKTIRLPDTCPWEVTPSIASPLFEHDVRGAVTPIAATKNLVVVEGEYSGLYNTTPTLIFPNIGESCMALPIFMDRRGHLFLIVADEFASHLIERYGYSTNPAGKGK